MEILFKIRVCKYMIHIASHILKTKRLIIVIIIAYIFNAKKF